MMNVLVVHDRKEVSEKLRTIIETAVKGSVIDIAEDGVSARSRLTSNIYDLMIIDLTLPHIKGGSADYRVADDLLKELFSLDHLNTPGDVIGLTKDAEALQFLNLSLGSHVMVMIQEDIEGNWCDLLVDKIRYASRVALTRQISVSKHFLYDALVITALDREFEPYKSKFDLLPVRHFPGAYEFPFADKSGVTRKGIALSIGKSGQARAASLTQSLLVAFRPRLALMSGFCGGVAGKAKLGDLMIFESSVDWDYGKWTEEPDRTEGSVGSKSVFLSRPTPIGIDGSPAHWAARQLIDSKFNEEGAVVREVKLLSKGNLTSFSVHLAPAASGSAVVTDHAIIKRIRGLNEAIRAVDMESYGFYFACSQTYVVKPQFICVKSVADFCNGEKGDEFHEACSEISAMGVIGMLRNWTFS